MGFMTGLVELSAGRITSFSTTAELVLGTRDMLNTIMTAGGTVSTWTVMRSLMASIVQTHIC